MRLSSVTLALGVVFIAMPRAAQQGAADREVAGVLASPPFAQTMAILDRDHDKMVSDIVTLTEIPSPPFKEDKRGAAVLALFKQTKLTNVERDAEGNVLGLRKGTGGGPLVAIAAHLDTVFPEGTDVKVTRTGTRLAAPGVGDDTRSLAVLLAIIRAMDAANVQTKTRHPLRRRRRRRGPRRSARDEAALPERRLHRSHQDVHLDRRHRRG